MQALQLKIPKRKKLNRQMQPLILRKPGIHSQFLPAVLYGLLGV